MTKSEENYFKNFDIIKERTDINESEKDELITELIRDSLDEKEQIEEEVAYIQKCFWRNFNL